MYCKNTSMVNKTLVGIGCEILHVFLVPYMFVQRSQVPTHSRHHMQLKVERDGVTACTAAHLCLQCHTAWVDAGHVGLDVHGWEEVLQCIVAQEPAWPMQHAVMRKLQ